MSALPEKWQSHRKIENNDVVMLPTVGEFMSFRELCRHVVDDSKGWELRAPDWAWEVMDPENWDDMDALEETASNPVEAIPDPRGVIR